MTQLIENRSWGAVAILTVLLAVVAAACGGDGDPSTVTVIETGVVVKEVPVEVGVGKGNYPLSNTLTGVLSLPLQPKSRCSPEI